ncbi:MAG TPA: tellurite resistance/C4-dicarboxylate transporter family protein [Thermoanaerobaculia bacterium]|nr:tellurite resistance/C4-dicarboxylate transporter family protein [Thermoanaerobaculia bacterium]
MTGLASLHPAYFAMVMATGIVSVACKLLGLAPVADALLAVNVATYAALWALTAARVARYPKRVFEDLVDHQRGVGFFTIVAATSVLGVQCLLVRDFGGAAAGLFVLSIALWVVLTYGVFAAFTVKETKPTLADGINGGWLVAVVATESIANLGGLLARRLSGPQDALHFFTLVFWLCGGMLYIWMISLIFYRYTFFHFSPSDLMPPYWINMGAMAISALAGTTLIANAAQSALLGRMLPFLLGFTALFWATATWWIPMLVILAVWRHGYRKLEMKYDPLYWGAVFPLGMYAVSTLRLAQAFDVPFLLFLPRVFLFVALAAWAATFTGLLRHLARAAGRGASAAA